MSQNKYFIPIFAVIVFCIVAFILTSCHVDIVSYDKEAQQAQQNCATHGGVRQLVGYTYTCNDGSTGGYNEFYPKR